MKMLHAMEHPEFDGVMWVGCQCAGHMANNTAKARFLETEAKAVMRVSAGAMWEGNDYEQCANTGKFDMTVRRFGKVYGCEFWHKGTRHSRHSKIEYTTMEAAKRAVVRGVVRSRATGSWKVEEEPPPRRRDPVAMAREMEVRCGWD